VAGRQPWRGCAANMSAADAWHGIAAKAAGIVTGEILHAQRKLPVDTQGSGGAGVVTGQLWRPASC